jgi:hypothetical protein
VLIGSTRPAPRSSPGRRSRGDGVSRGTCRGGRGGRWGGGDCSIAAAPLHRLRGGARSLPAAALCRRTRRDGRARYRRAAPRTRFVVDAAPRYSGSRRGEAPLSPRGAAVGIGAAGSRGSARNIAGPPRCRVARACQTGRLGGCRVRPGQRRGTTRAGRPAIVRPGRRGRRAAKAGGAGAGSAVRRCPDRFRAWGGLWPRPDRARRRGRWKTVSAAASRS